MKQEKSCGAVVYRRKESGKIKILLICIKNGGHWSFPKGHVEKKETEEETALREIKEETGLKVQLHTDFRHVVTYSPKQGVMKDVVFFAAESSKKEIKCQEEEVLDAHWFSPEKALEKITYDSDREVLKEFLEYAAAM